MIPLRDDNPTRSFAILTLLLIAANIAVFVYQLSLPNVAALQAFVADFGVVPAQITEPASPLVYRTVMTSMFLHGGWLHLAGNMLYLWIFGNNIEDACGRLRFLFFYLLCGLAAAGTQIAINPASTIPMIGASGAVSGILGAYLILYPHARVTVLIPIWIFLKFVQVPAWLMLVVWFGFQLLSGTATLGRVTGGGVAFWAHIGGFVAGMILIPIFKQRRVRLFR
jgi:membrane associated rhomboid family serine protease